MNTAEAMVICTQHIGWIPSFEKQSSPSKQPSKQSAKQPPKVTSVNNQQASIFSLEDHQAARRKSSKCYILNQNEVKTLIRQEKDIEKQALLIAYIIDAATKGIGTDDASFAAAIYGISKDNVKLVEKLLKEIGIAYKGTGVENYINNETSGDKQKDFLRHINQFKK